MEQFVVCEGDLEVSRKLQEEMIAAAEEFYQSLGIAYRVVNIVSGELNNAAIKKVHTWVCSVNALCSSLLACVDR